MFSALARERIFAFVLAFLILPDFSLTDISVSHCLDNRFLAKRLLSASLTCGENDFKATFEKDQTPIFFDSPFHPWSYEPVCTEFLDNIGSELCVYTNTTFSNGIGISIFTTPKIAEQFAELLPFQDAAALEGINGPKGPWYTNQLSGKGTAMIADRNLERGELITAYTPVLLVYMDRVLSTRDRERLLRLAIDQLPTASREAYFKLTTIYGNPDVIAQDVLKANNFEIQIGGEMHLAIFPEASRLNHDCAPNAQYHLDPFHLTHYVHAARSISAHEEITISYTNPLQPHQVRQEYLQEAFHFSCNCARCQSGENSDAALDRINSFQKELADFDPTSAATIEMAEGLIKIYENQGLQGFLGEGYGFAAMTYNSYGDVETAKKYAKLAAETIAMKDGTGGTDYQAMKMLGDSPERHWSWRTRK